MTTLYFLPRSRITGNIASLPPEEAHHAVNVVRHKVGDVIHAVDGEGGSYEIQLCMVGKRIADGEILSTEYEIGESEYTLTVGMALLKNQKRFDVFIEKAVELGVSRVIPMITARTEKKTIKNARVEKILIAAMKQCGRSRLVQLDEVTPLKTVLETDSDTLLLCCHEKVDEQQTLGNMLASSNKRKGVTVLIGPEGGFTDQEITLIESTGFHMVSLGNRRLRAETAAIVASAGVMLYKP